MIYSEAMLLSLSEKVKSRISAKRYEHTLGVMKSASRLSKFLLPEKESELCAAALLHDIAKEFEPCELLDFIKADGILLSDDELLAVPTLHSFASPYIIKRDFPEFASEEILSACKNHTLGSPDMSIFEEIIFISDYIEDTRSYESCKTVRDGLYSELKPGDYENNIKALHKATVLSIDYTLMHLNASKKKINNRIILTKNAFMSKI